MLDQQTQNESIGDNERLMLRRIVALVVLWLALPGAGADAGAALAATATAGPATTPKGGRGQNLSQRLDSARADKSLAQARASLVVAARKAAAEPLIRRCYRLEEIGRNRTFYDGRADSLGEDTKLVFACAMSDHGAGMTLSAELPLIAAGYRLSGEESLKRRVIEQLEEVSSWSPLQRPGWTCYAPGLRLPKDGKDGAWLATGTGVRAIADALEILPPQEVPPELRAKLESLLRTEIAQVVDDWQRKRPWFFRDNNPITNQWVLPNEGLVRACLVLGRDKFPDDYELGMSNLLRSLDSHGKKGEFEEGLSYATFTVTSLVATARAAAVDGDRRLIDHPFLQHFPIWVMHHLLPSRKVINAFDCFTNSAPRSEGAILNMLAFCGSYLGSSPAAWAVANLFDGPPNTLEGLLCRLTPAAAEGPAPFAAYERATRVNWRDNWGDNGSALWVRGGHADDQHDHQDRGHLSFVHKGRLILIEAGTPAYHNPRLHTHYSTGMGHNVLQIGDAPAPARAGKAVAGWQKSKTVAPIDVRRLDASGGDIVVDASACYNDLAKWCREVKWTAASVEVRDEVVLAGDKAEHILFRWHLGTRNEVRISGGGGRWVIAWDSARLDIESVSELRLTQEQLPEHTLEQRTWTEGHDDQLHACLIVRTAAPIGTAGILTRITAK